MDEEIRFHIDQQTEKNVRRGMSRDEARRAALIRFGGVERVKEAARDEFRASLLEDFSRDLRYGIRVLRRAPGFAVVSILTLGLGIGAATAVFSVVDGVLLRPLPFPEPDRIVRLFQIDSTGRRNNSVSEPNFLDWQARTRSFRAMAEMGWGAAVPVLSGSEPRLAALAMVSRDFFEVMGVAPLVGRAFAGDELRTGGTPAAVVSDAYWRRALGGRGLETLAVRIGPRAFQVVGVMPPAFDYPVGTEIWIPRELEPPQTSRTAHNFQVIARLADGVDLAGARSDLSAVSRALKIAHGDATWMSDATALPLRDQLTATARPVLLILFGAALLLLVIACLNASNLQLARASTRQREIALRLAIGAGRGRITRQLLAEACALSFAGGLVGVAIAYWGVAGLLALQPGNLPRIQDVEVNWVVLAFGFGLAVAAAVALGLITAVRASDQDLQTSLTEGQRTTTGARARERMRQTLAIAQVALTLVLLAGAGLLIRSFVRVMSVDPGFRTDRVLVLDLAGPLTQDEETRRRRPARQRELLARLRALPGVEDVGLINDFPLGAAFYPNGRFIEMDRIDELTTREDVARLGDLVKTRAGSAGYRIASDRYFSTLGIPLIRGRLFDESDGPDAPHVAVISETLARTKWPDQDPIGRFVQFGNMDGNLRGFRIVGIVGDVREVSPEALPDSIFYGFYQQRITSRASVIIRADAPAGLIGPARQIVQELDPEQPVRVRTIEDAFDRALAGRRFSLTLIGVFGGAALILATLGVYGLISYLVAQRTREIGIRMALGASSVDLVRLIVGKGAMLAGVGTAVGLTAALGLSRLVEGLLFGVTARDPIAFAAVVALMLGAALLASYLPARRALKIAPVDSLRST